MNYSKVVIYALATLMATSTAVLADDDDDDDDHIPFEEGWLFFELNDTDGDLGIHGKIDGDGWKLMEIKDPKGRRMLKAKVQGRLKRQGLTELFFESAEPTFDELDPVDFFERFPEGIYEIKGKTLDGEKRQNEVFLSHVIPAAPAAVTINGADAAVNCDADVLPVVSPTGGVTISWDAVTESHMTLGSETDTSLAMLDIEVRYYEVIVEIDETDFKSTAIVPAEVTEWTFTEDFFDLSEDDEYKFEILIRVNNPQTELEGEPIPGNKSAIESCFEVS